jgi:hypothetical protein
MPPDFMEIHDPTGAGRRRSAMMRPSCWPGADAVPGRGAFCGKCEGQRWYGNENGWSCTTCHPGAEACGGGTIVETGGAGHG